MRRTPSRPLRLLPLALAGLALTGCSGSSPSALSPHGVGAARVAGLWWLIFWISVVVVVIVSGLAVFAVVARRGENVRPSARSGRRVVVISGIVLPAIVLVIVYGVSLNDMSAQAGPKQSALTIDVTGHLWWWEVRYEGTDAVTANEIHIPVGQRVKLRLTTADVNHSFWVPQLVPKTDLVAGRVNETWITATKAGSYRGQCAEYCGIEHAHMAFLVVASPQATFQGWLAKQEQPAPSPQTAEQARGLQVLQTASCASCHTLRGTSAHGNVGPDLTHLGSRSRLGAGAIANTPGYLGGWISNSQAIKPGNKMPAQPLSSQDLQAVIAYLESTG